MTKSNASKKLNDLLQLTVIAAILMSFAGYEAHRKGQAQSVSSPELTKSAQDKNSEIPKDSLRFTKAILHTHPSY